MIDELIRLPVTSLEAGLNLFAGLLEGMQSFAGRSVEAFFGNAGRASSAPCQQAGGSRATQPNDRKEEWTMVDQNLSGDDLKLVRYSVVFVKPEHELLLKQAEELVNYSTDGATYGSIKIGEVISDLGKLGEAPPREDWKYLRFSYRVEGRWSKEDPDWPKQQVEVLRGISQQIGGLSAKIG